MTNEGRTVFVNDEKEMAEKLLEQAYLELGKEYYEGAFEDPLPQLLPLFDRITKIKNELDGRKKVSRRQFCPYCGQENDVSSVFCGYCGKKMTVSMR